MVAVLFAHWGCKGTIGASSLIKQSLEKTGLPTMILDGDGCNPANTSDGQVSTQASGVCGNAGKGQGGETRMIHYVCKYTPIELFRGFGEECSVLEEMPENFEHVGSDCTCKSVRLWKIGHSGSAGRKG